MPEAKQRHGAWPDETGHTHFALWAPDAKSVAVKLQDDTQHAMTASDNGWYAATLPVAAGTDYHYLIDEHLLVPDPASRWQANDVHGPSRVADPSRYQWRNAGWQGRPWQETVLYEVHVGTLGGYQSAQARLQELADLGVTAIELMPLGEFPGGRNWGYDGVLPFAPDSSYGTPDQLRALIDHAHELGLMVFIDVVYNHFGPDGNYLGQYASDFFREDVHTPWGPAIDFRRRQVRDYFIDNALMWVHDYRVDGLRFDAVHAIGERDFLIEMAERLHASIPASRHLHLVLENEHNDAELLQQGFVAQWNDDGHNVLHHLLTGEHEGYYADFASDATHKLARCLREGFIYQGETTRHGTARGSSSGHLPPSAFVLFLQNHDQVGNRAVGERLRTLAEDDALKSATALLLLSPMIPLLFMGEEWGSEQPFQFFTSHNDELGEAVRKGRQNEFKDFSKFSGQAIPAPNDASTFETSKPDHHSRDTADGRAWLAFYRELLSLRHQHIVPRLASSQALDSRVLGEAAVAASWQLGDGQVLHIALNLGGEPVGSALPQSARTLFSYRADGDHLLARSVRVVLEGTV
ncbi:malto-oligosyltrehalose trehalohydrolase [Pseudomonas straminea]|uniref:Malto-oligosyltrehalose trehalohydrolase n=1 Tax=Pseudomonas straminea TaxID=47882 RepID=A0A1I1SZB4_PSEOC|nr:malto-oligosyltrehalose trehalohydrolase [Pseudomonas straminea]GLX12706.1 malto-oligosyltrehalose trehalohydrolase [Pseudomonas straminea]SFD51671.1 maltooligosyltrehalose trehalohydrolase [Pseudomonas straminea]